MKLRNLIIPGIIIVFTMHMQSYGQRGQMRDLQKGTCINLPDLTEEQEQKIEALRLERIAARTAHRAEMDELRARKRSLGIAENPDMDALNNVIDQMTAARARHMKDNEAHRQEIRKLLTPEQRTLFDSRRGQRRGGNEMFRQRDHRRDDFRGEGRRGGGRRF